MNIVKPRVLSGFKDRLPAEAIKKREILEKLIVVFESFGFVPIETPHLEHADILVKRGSEEIQKELYRFRDHGDRDVALRFDLTVPLARFAAQHRGELKFPFKRYALGNVFRGERAQAGRYREFTQCDFDFLGSESVCSDAEVAAIISKGFEALGIEKFKISINNRKIMNGFAKSLGVEDRIEDILRVVDKLDKIGRDRVKDELKDIGIDQSVAVKVLDFISLKESLCGFFDALDELKKDDALKEGIDELLEFYELLEAFGVDRGHFEIDFSIARGLAYYTGIVYESRLLEYPEIGSVASGGRYDDLTSNFSKEKISGVGASFGVDRLIAALEKLGVVSEKSTTADILCVNFGKKELTYILKAASILRRSGIKTEVYPDSAKLKKQFDFADKKGFEFVLIAGESEIEKESFLLKNMKSGEQKEMKIDGIVKTLKEQNENS
ncbi:MAG: histidine--tRNA ligase [Campylobacterales bacterium]